MGRPSGLGMSGSVVVGSDLDVTGESPAVLGAPDAEVLVLIAGDDVVVVDAAAEGVTVTALDALDTTRSVGSVALRGVTVAEDRVLRGAARARTVFRILASAEAVGVAWASLEMAVEYAKVREQFGRTIGTFQAVKHHAANMLVDAEQTTAAVWDAARADDLDSLGSPPRWRPLTPSGRGSSTRRTIFSCTAASVSPGSMTRTSTFAAPARWRH